MARPVKNYCDYFPHDRDMRDHRKIKALRTKFGISGYGIWCMTLEYLTGIDGNVIEFNETELELMSGDYGVSASEIRNVLDYCIKLELLFVKDGFLHSESLDERLKPVYDKRGVSKGNSSKQLRSSGKFISNNTVSHGVTEAEMPQSKVNKSKVNNTSISAPAVGNEIIFNMIVLEMINVWKVHKPNYMSEREIDSHACLNIAYYIAEKKGWTKESVTNVREKEIINSWKKIIVFIVNGKDEFFKRLTLDGIANRKNLQKIVEAMSQANSTVKAAQTADDIIEQENRKLLEQASRKQ